MLQLEVPGGGRKVLLHSCCAPCSGAVLESLLASGIEPVVFFSNSNIVPREEYELRLHELERYCTSLGVTLVADEYDHEAWLTAVLEKDGPAERQVSLASAPERGERCLNCFKFRLLRAARYAREHSIPVLTTTLASSRWKSLEQVDAAGNYACSAVSPLPKETYGAKRPEGSEGNAPKSNKQFLLWWGQNWRKGGLQERRSQIICEQNFYNQNWCGCEFSHHD